MIATGITMSKATDLSRSGKGRYLERPDSLERTTIGLRLPKSLYPAFVAIAEDQEKPTATLAREIIVEWFATHAASDADKATAVAWLKAQDADKSSSDAATG